MAGRRRVAGATGHRQYAPSVQMPGNPICPGWLPPDAKKEWKRIIRELKNLDLLRSTDTSVLASYCVSFARWKQSEATLTLEGTTIKVIGAKGQEKFSKHPALLVSSESQRQMLRAGSLLGFNPIDRAKIAAPVKSEINPFAALLDDSTDENEDSIQ